MDLIGSAHASRVERVNSVVARPVADGTIIAAVQRSLQRGPHDEPQPDLIHLRPKVDFYAAALPRLPMSSS